MCSQISFYGITSKSKLLIESYLANRYQRVQLDNSILNLNAVSRWSKVKHGAPQGSDLGPLLFLLYINDLPNAVTHNALPILFADDTSILITSHNVHKFQNDLNSAFGQITNWFQALIIEHIFKKEQTVPIYIPWKVPILDPTIPKTRRKYRG